MSHEIVKSIVMKEGKVWVNSADSSIRPLDFNTWEPERLSKMLQEEGRPAVLAAIGENVFDGNWKLYQGNKLTRLYLQAMEPLQRRNIHWSNFDGQAVGEYLAAAVQKLEQFPDASLEDDVGNLLALRGSKEYLLDAARRTGHSFLNYADAALQKDRELAMEIVRICGDKAWFEMPKYFREDREIVLEAVRRNGCNYRQLDKESPLKADKEIIMVAFEDRPGRTYHEHLPDEIPPAVYIQEIPGRYPPIVFDNDFWIELLEKCPGMHIERTPWVLEVRDVALKWCEVGKHLPFDVRSLPKKYASDLEFQDVLARRFEGTEKWEVLVKKFEEKGILISSVNDLIANAKGCSNKQKMERSVEDLGK